MYGFSSCHVYCDITYQGVVWTGFVHGAECRLEWVRFAAVYILLLKIDDDLICTFILLIDSSFYRTHTHGGPAGYLQYLLYDVTGLGFVQQTFDALVDGIVRAIQLAHDDLAPGSASVTVGELLDANINRSPTAYEANPAEERSQYAHNIDKNMTVLSLFGGKKDSQEALLKAAFSWFPVHGTSMNNTNELISGDNKGAAAQFLERRLQREQTNDVVTAFCQANVGDTSPNILGAFCMDTGLPCDAVHSTCNGRVQQCIGRGPAFPDNFQSTRVIGQRQAEKAYELLNSSGSSKKILTGAIEYKHKFLDMSNVIVEKSKYTRAGKTCTPALGYSFAAGTTDGPGAFDFYQSETNSTAFWRMVRNFIHPPTPEQEDCHSPKPILLDVGNFNYPYPWVPKIVEIQILRLGQFVILCVPSEFTTMAGRRLKAAVNDVVQSSWGPDLEFVIAGLTNTYSSYVTTFEEYQVQRYEGGFTLFGPHTLDAYIQEFRSLAQEMVDGKEVVAAEEGPQPPNLLPLQWSLVPPVIDDGLPAGVNFGSVYLDVTNSMFRQGDVVSATFHSGCPRNDVRAGGTFMTVEKKVAGGRHDYRLSSSFLGRWVAVLTRMMFGGSTKRESGGARWEVVHTDDDWVTKFSWARHETLSSHSFARLEWTIPAAGDECNPGVYRLRHFGNYKHFLGSVVAYEGASSEFEVQC